MNVFVPKYVIRFMGCAYIVLALGGPFLVGLLSGLLSAGGMHLWERQTRRAVEL